jgi:DNA polymerase III epsilon subunit family exonuclease
MNDSPKTFTCIVLDLETTWLSPELDTIIEIAAIKITIWKADGTWKIIEQDERSMLVNPGYNITEEISLITHITNDMLTDKPKWEEVCERAKEFLGDHPIVGHNVLFDVAMLGTHDIDISKSLILDTFELSELLSSEVPSLNLWFLAKHYGYTTDKGEHRALGDTEVCAQLFIWYLNMLEELGETERSILRLSRDMEVYPNISFLLDLLEDTSTTTYTIPEGKKSYYKENKVDTLTSTSIPKNTWKMVSFNEPKEEEIFLQETLSGAWKVHIITNGHQSASYRKEYLNNLWFESDIIRGISSYYSTLYIDEVVSAKKKVERKLFILILRVLLWIEKTETGILSELKIYGKENEFKQLFELRSNEENIFSLKQKTSQKKVLIAEAKDYLSSDLESPHTLIIEEAWFFDDKIRIHESFHIDFIKWKDYVSKFAEAGHTKDRVLFALAFIERMYIWIGKGWVNEEVPENTYSETYFFNQDTLWLKGGIWLDIATKMLVQWCDGITWNGQSTEVEKSILMSYTDSCKQFLWAYHRYTSSRTSIIIEVTASGIIAHYIPKDISYSISKFISWAWKDIYLTGYGMNGEKCLQYLSKNFPIDPVLTTTTPKDNVMKKHIQVIGDISGISLGGSMILTTSMKHIRELWSLCRARGYTVFMQGTSWWKSKITNLFLENSENAVIIGLIDSWKDEYQLWKHIKNLIVAKLPFDPPSDPYFLAKTVGVTNNFSSYSEPMVIFRINRLIGKYKSYGIAGQIFTLDTRLFKAEWGKTIYDELI